MGFNIYLQLSLTAFFLYLATGADKLGTVTARPPTGRFTVSGDLVFVTKAPPARSTAVNDLTFEESNPTPGPNGAFCDIFAQDCPDNFKCTSEDLSSQPRCRPLDNNPDSVGDPCSTKGNNDGDTCDEEGLCINGVCRPLCTGSNASPFCPDIKQLCHRYVNGPPLCEDKCDPIIAASCNGGGDRYCSTDSGLNDGRFTCMYETGEQLGLQGDSCVETSQCQQGFACMIKTVLPPGFCHNGAALSCCTPLVEDADDCPAGTAATDFYQFPPPGLEHLMVCVH